MAYACMRFPRMVNVHLHTHECVSRVQRVKKGGAESGIETHRALLRTGSPVTPNLTRRARIFIQFGENASSILHFSSERSFISLSRANRPLAFAQNNQLWHVHAIGWASDVVLHARSTLFSNTTQHFFGVTLSYLVGK